MLLENPTRRRAIAILAATAAGIAAVETDPSRPALDYEWRGLCMGTDARILFCGIDAASAHALVEMAVAEIDRLERALSLYRRDSEICRLNERQALHRPSGDMRRALALAIAIAQATDGLFDPTVQALWEAHVDWFARQPAAGLPPESFILAARSLVDWKRIVLGANLIELGDRQRITLNGLAQGYVTDRVADLLRAQGVEHVLVDLGEQRALGPRGSDSPWLIACDRGKHFKLVHGALATSEGTGCVLGAAGAAHHLFDPRTGRSAARWQRITVHHPSAAVADALSTAIYAAAPNEIERMLPHLPDVAVLAVDRQGRERHWNFDRVTGVSI